MPPCADLRDERAVIPSQHRLRVDPARLANESASANGHLLFSLDKNPSSCVIRYSQPSISWLILCRRSIRPVYQARMRLADWCRTAERRHIFLISKPLHYLQTRPDQQKVPARVRLSLRATSVDTMAPFEARCGRSDSLRLLCPTVTARVFAR